MDAGQRIEQVISYIGGSRASVAKRAGLAPQRLTDIVNRKTKEISFEVADGLVKASPELSRVWLLTGEGEMLHRGEVNVGGVDYNNSGGNHTHTHNSPLDLLSALNKSQALVEQSQSLQVKSQEQIDRLLGIIEKMQSKE